MAYGKEMELPAVTPKWTGKELNDDKLLVAEDDLGLSKQLSPPAGIHQSPYPVKDASLNADSFLEVNDAELARMDAELAELEKEASGAKPTFFSSTWLTLRPEHFTWVLVIFASMGGLLSGLDQSLISGANLYMPAALDLTTNEVSLVNALMPLGAVGGALILGPCNEILGRKMSIIIACILYTIGAALEAGAMSFGMMAGGRVVLGIGLGLEGGTVPVYVAECVPSGMRGNLVSLYQFAIALGEVFGYVVAAIFVNVPGTWRWMLGSSLVFSTILLFGMFLLPESPRFLEHKGKRLDAYIVWKKIRGFNTLESKTEFFVMRQVVEKEAAEERQLGGAKYAFIDFYRVPRARRAIVYANIMIFLGQFTGVNAVMYYMATLMRQAGFDDQTAVFMSLVGGGSLLLGTIPAILFMDKLGRRAAAIGLLPIFFIGLVLVGVSSVTPISNLGLTQGLYLSGVILYMGGFGSYACLTWVIPSEVYPTYLRSYGMVTSDATLFLCAFIMTYCFQMMEQSMTLIGVALGFFGGIAVLGEVYQILCMPETKNKTLEEIDALFEMPTRELMALNWASTKQTVRDMFAGRWRQAAGWTD